MIATKHDLTVLLADATAHGAALAHLQCLMDERYQHDAAGVWGVVEPNGLTRLGLTAAEAVEMGAVDRVVDESARVVDLDAAKAAACAAIDARAETLRASALTPGAGQAVEYFLTQSEAVAALTAAAAGNAVAPEEYVMLTAEQAALAATVGEIDLLDVARTVIAKFRACKPVMAAVKAARRGGKEAVRAAADPAGVLAARDGVQWPQC